MTGWSFPGPARCDRSGLYQGEPPQEGELLFERVHGDQPVTVLRWRLGGVLHVWRLPYYLDGPVPPIERYDG